MTTPVTRRSVSLGLTDSPPFPFVTSDTIRINTCSDGATGQKTLKD